MRRLRRLADLLADPSEQFFVREQLSAATPENVAEALHTLDDEDSVALVALLDAAQAAEVLREVDARTLGAVASAAEAERLAAIVAELSPDDAADFVAAVGDQAGVAHRRGLLAALAPEPRQAIEALLAYDPESAGGLMTPRFVAVPVSASVAEALQAIRDAPDADTIATIYVRDPAAAQALVGVCSPRELILAAPETPVREVMETELVAVGVDDDQEDVAALFEKYDLPTLPVIDAERRVLGVVTFDDAIDVTQEELDEDIALVAGMGAHDPIAGSVWVRLRARLPWLFITLGGTFVTAAVLRGFQHTLATIVSVMFFVPAVTAMSGNVGLQSSTTFVRALALGEVQYSQLLRLVYDEVRVGALIGIVCGVVLALGAGLLGVAPGLGLIVGLSMFAGIAVASIVGTIVPLVCERLGIDPALAAGPFVSTLNDILAVTIYLTIATLSLTAW